MIENKVVKFNPELKEVLAYGFPSYELTHSLDPHVIHVVNQLISCKSSTLGGHKITCLGCGEEVIEYNSCRNKNCPQCNQGKQENWFVERSNKLIPGNYYHLIFKVPQDLNEMFLV